MSILLIFMSFILSPCRAVGSRRSRTNNNANARNIGILNESGVKVRLSIGGVVVGIADDDEGDDNNPCIKSSAAPEYLTPLLTSSFLLTSPILLPRRCS
jgi:hypothetical protein